MQRREWNDLHEATYGSSPSVPTNLRSSGFEPLEVTCKSTKAVLSSLRGNLRTRIGGAIGNSINTAKSLERVCLCVFVRQHQGLDKDQWNDGRYRSCGRDLEQIDTTPL
jgi:hypothetical protein